MPTSPSRSLTKNPGVHELERCIWRVQSTRELGTTGRLYGDAGWQGGCSRQKDLKARGLGLRSCGEGNQLGAHERPLLLYPAKVFALMLAHEGLTFKVIDSSLPRLLRWPLDAKAWTNSPTGAWEHFARSGRCASPKTWNVNFFPGGSRTARKSAAIALSCSKVGTVAARRPNWAENLLSESNFSADAVPPAECPKVIG